MKKFLGAYTLQILITSVIVMIAVAILFVLKTEDDGVQTLIGVSQPNLTDSFQIQLYNELYEMESNNEEMYFACFDAGYSVEKQKDDIENLLSLGLDALIVVTFDPESISDSIQEAYDTGIPVIIIGYAPEKADYTTRIYTDNFEIGSKAGEYVKTLANIRECIVMEIQGDPYSRESRDLKNGFSSAIDKYDNITKEYVMTGYWSQESTRNRMHESDFFSKKPQINVIFAQNDMMAAGAAANLRETRKKAYIISVGGFKLKNSDLIMIRDGIINATFTQPTGAEQAVYAILQSLNGEEVKKEYRLETMLVTKENVELFLEN